MRAGVALRRPPLRAACVLSLLLVGFILPPAAEVRADPTETVTVVTAADNRFSFHVEIADTTSKRARGLMFRQRLATDAGMLFLFDELEVASFWMKNTPLSLDLLFIAKDGRIVDMYERAVPLSTRPINSNMPVFAVLEILAGTAQRLGIRVGDRIDHKAFSAGG